MEDREKKVKINSYYENTQEYYNNRFGINFQAELNEEEMDRWRAIEQQVKVLSENIQKESLDILDFGCGNGRFTLLLSQYGNSMGIDIAEKAIEKAKDQFSNIPFFVCDVTGNDVQGILKKKFDLIVSTEVIEHVLDQDIFLRNIFALLQANGYLILTTPNGRWFNQYFEFGKKKGTQPYEFWLSLKELEKKLNNSGFEVTFSKTFHSNWIFFFRTFGLLKIVGNRATNYVLKFFKLKKAFIKIANFLGVGIYLIIVARKARENN